MRLKLKSFTIVNEETGKEETVDVDLFDLEYKVEYGMNVYDSPGGCPVVESNGQQRLMIKAWKGCNAYDNFKTDARGGE